MRHAKSSWADAFVDDFERALNKRGRKAAASLSKWLKSRDFETDFVLCSAALRTRQTLELVQDGFKTHPEVSIERRLYLAEADQLRARLGELGTRSPSPAAILLIGHNPGLEELALRLVPPAETATRARIEAKFPTCAFVALRFMTESWAKIGPANATLDAYRIPADDED
ncbi:MAG: SixA phosphatase family protein [Tagaea sp.]